MAAQNQPYFNGWGQQYVRPAPRVRRPADRVFVGPLYVTMAGDSAVTVTLSGTQDITLSIAGQSAVSVRFYHLVGPTIVRVADPIAAALSGQNGPIVLGCTVEQRDAGYNFAADLTAAVIACPVTLDNDRPVARTAALTFDARKLPAGFQGSLASKQCVSITVLVLVGSQFVAFPFGLFYLDLPEVGNQPRQAGQWRVSASDVTLALANRTPLNPYTVPAGTSYSTAVSTILTLVGLSQNLPALPTATLPVDVTWPAQTPYLTIVNDLLLGLNCYPLHADPRGLCSTAGVRTDPALVVSSVSYSTVAEPRMLDGATAFTTKTDVSSYANVCTVAIDDPLRAAVVSTHTNADPGSPISTVSSGKNTLKELKGGTGSKCVLDGPTAGQIAAFELREAAARAQGASFATLLDPRRTNREWYTLSIDGYEAGSLWRVGKWTANLDPLMRNPLMTHEVGRAKAVTIT